jgi:hypothetical protein
MISWTYKGNPGSYVVKEIYEGDTLNYMTTSLDGIVINDRGAYNFGHYHYQESRQ